MLMAEELYSYKNGNYQVSLYSDGTKVREGSDLIPEYPESIDVKITDFCEEKCSFCYEGCTPSGKASPIVNYFKFFSELPKGTELAIGGGDPLTHPTLDYFLQFLKELCELVPNLTINGSQLKSKALNKILQRKSIYGLGVSYNENYLDDLLKFDYWHTVVHFVIGIHSFDTVMEFLERKPESKILLLGFKNQGRAKTLYSKTQEEIDNNLKRWNQQAYKLLANKEAVISFDTLGTKQLKLQRFFTKEGWNKYFMGEDGQYTMYLDLVNSQYAVSSTFETRFNIPNNATMKELFKHVRELWQTT
jgi:hypothetical protein